MWVSQYSIGVDLGGTNLRAAAVDENGVILEQLACGTNPELGREHVLGAIVDAIQDLQGRHTDRQLAGVGIGVPGFILIEEGIVLNSNNLPFLEGFPLRDEFIKRLEAPVILENDANSAALGEMWIGAGAGVKDLAIGRQVQIGQPSALVTGVIQNAIVQIRTREQ